MELLDNNRLMTISHADIIANKMQDLELQNRILKQVNLGIHLIDETGRLIEANATFCQMLGYTPEEILTLSVFDWDALFPHDELTSMLVAARDKGVISIETLHRRKDGSVFDVEINSTSIQLGGVYYLWSYSRDITERKIAEKKIHQLAFYDQLTNLPNRRCFLEHLDAAITASASSGQYGSVLFIDLDNFKVINDTQGHLLGDLLLVEVAERLQTCVQADDTVARLGGDEFVVVIKHEPGTMNTAAAVALMVAEKMRHVLSLPYDIDTHQHFSSCSIGVVMFQGRRVSASDLLKHADTAMYQAKSAGRNATRLFDPAMQAKLEARAMLESEIRRAIVLQQFLLYYQIQIGGNGLPIGAEVLLRWQHPVHGMYPPTEFISLMEETGLIIPVGQWVLKAACVQLHTWHDNVDMRGLRLAVNVSAKQFGHVDFVKQLEHTLLETGADPSLLKLELTESVVLGNVDDAIEKMHAIKSLGVSISMDDFGTGYSSLQYLKRLPLDQIKIDQSFVRDITTDKSDAAIVEIIIAMSSALGLNVIAEGVETEGQYQFLYSQGCHAFQGYLFSRPIALAEFEQLYFDMNAVG